MDRRRLAITAWLTLAAAALACDAGPVRRLPAPVEVETVRAGETGGTLVVSGVVDAEARLALGFRVGGVVERFGADVDDRVEAGEVLAELDRTQLERSAARAREGVESARARLEEAELSLSRAEVEAPGGDADDLEETLHAARLRVEVGRTEVRLAKLELEVASDRFEAGVLRAPVGGWIERRLGTPHEYVDAGVPVLVLTRLGTVRVRTAAPAGDSEAVRVGALVAVRTAAWPGREFAGRVSRVDAARDAGRAVPFEVELANPDLLLRPGMPVEIGLRHGSARTAHMVPRTAVLRGVGGEPISFVVVGEGAVLRVVARRLSLGSAHGDRIVVAEGLEAGDRVVTQGQRFVTVGERVRIISTAR